MNHGDKVCIRNNLIELVEALALPKLLQLLTSI